MRAVYHFFSDWFIWFRANSASYGQFEYLSTLSRYSHKYVSKTQLVYGFILIFVFIYLMLGAFPIVPLENDGMRIALGAESKSLYGNYAYAYNYQEQSGTYKLLELNFGLDPFYFFSYLTIASCIIFLLASCLFLVRLTHHYCLICLAALLFFQETYISAYYPNSTIIAAAFLAVALLLATWKEKTVSIVLAGILFALAFWIRFDAILVGGAFVVLLWQTVLRWFRIIVVFGGASIVTGLFLFLISHTSPLAIVHGYVTHAENSSNFAQTMNSYSTIFTLAVVYFGGLGLYHLFVHKQWHLVFLIGAFLPLLVAYGFAALSPKYLLYALVCFAIPICYGLTILIREHTRRSAWALCLGVTLFAGQYIFTPAYELVLNRSTIVYTADEARLRGAIAYTPLYWAKNRRTKLLADLQFQKNLSMYLTQNPSSYLISHDWMTNQWVLYFLQKQGYRIETADNYAPVLEDGQRIIMTKNATKVDLVRWRPERVLDLPNALQMEVRAMPQVLYIGPDYTTTDYAQKSFLSKGFTQERLLNWGRFETILFLH